MWVADSVRIHWSGKWKYILRFLKVLKIEKIRILLIKIHDKREVVYQKRYTCIF